MKTKFRVVLIMIFAIIITGCEDKELDVVTNNRNIITYEFPDEKQDVLETFGAIAQSIRDGDMDQLISFHAYSPKFTEFKNGELRNGAEANEAHERSVFGAVTEVVKFDANDLKIAVYGEVANLTFHSDFHLRFGDDLVIVNDQITLLFVKTDDGWKMVHEHHSPLML
jgi:ketosteroid isomerase-like protein|nr:nuclear transport factor 2 family protein [uncultured Psychroserpens sp.]